MASPSLSEARSEVINLVKKKNTKSKAWIYFGLRANEIGQIVEEHQHHPICRKCGAVVHAKDDNTSNLFQHLRDHHADLFASISTGSGASESNTKTQQTIESSLARSTKYPRGSPQAKELTRAITYYLAKDAMPIYTVEKAGFQHMVSKLDPCYEIPFSHHKRYLCYISMYGMT